MPYHKKLKISNYLATVQLEDPEWKEILNFNHSSCKIKKHYFSLADVTFYCDMSTNIPHPFIPETFRSKIFHHIHNLSHPGVLATIKLITKRYFWPHMKNLIKQFVQSCLSCQSSKIHKHTKAPTAHSLCQMHDLPIYISISLAHFHHLKVILIAWQ